jgi:hypothetical protein
MDELTQKDIFELSFAAFGYMHTIFQIWITVTFGAILAVYFSSTRITRYMRYLIVSLYAGASIMLFGRWIVWGFTVAALSRTAEGSGYVGLPSLAPEFLVSNSVFMNIGLFAIGSLATTYFLATFENKGKSK